MNILALSLPGANGGSPCLLQVRLERRSHIRVDHGGDALHASSASETADVVLGDTQDVLAEDLAAPRSEVERETVQNNGHVPMPLERFTKSEASATRDAVKAETDTTAHIGAD